MDIAGLAVLMSQTQLMQAASMSVLKIAMEGPARQMEEVMAAMQAMEKSVSPHLGTNIDVTA